jgi:hypothetical protein
MSQICLRPCESDSDFHVKTHPVISVFKKKISVLLVGSHVGEKLKTDFQPGFHQK